MSRLRAAVACLATGSAGTRVPVSSSYRHWKPVVPHETLHTLLQSLGPVAAAAKMIQQVAPAA